MVSELLSLFSPVHAALAAGLAAAVVALTWTEIDYAD